MKIYNLKPKNQLKKVNKYTDIIILLFLITAIAIVCILGYKTIFIILERLTLAIFKFFFILINGEC